MRLATLNLPAGPTAAEISPDGTAFRPLAAAGIPLLALILEIPEPGIPWQRLDPATLLAPIPRPARNIFCVGKNYHEHAAEFARSGFDTSAAKGETAPAYPVVFTKPPSAVIGRPGRGITRAAALSHVFGYTIVNDVTARDLQQRHRQWFLGKSMDSHCPMGPWIVTADAIPDPAALDLRCTVNGELRQQANTRDLIFDIPTIIATISAGITLEPGDIIATGTPAGVGIGFDPPRFLRAGDRVVIEIAGIGTLSNPVAA